jgi:ferric-dicitrate binding protein FerR (iron transport regulator)
MPESSNDGHEELDQLLYKYYAYQLTEVEERRLEEFCRQRPGLRSIMRRLDNKDLVRRDIAHMEKLQAKKSIRAKSKVVRWGIGLAAASLLVIIWVTSLNDSKTEKHTVSVSLRPKPADSTSASLYLSDGRKVMLASLPNGEKLDEVGVTITRAGSGHLSYRPLPNASSVSADTHLIHYNTLETPKGGQYKVTLPDGSNAWLNNASSLRYPTFFAGDKREVYLSGEAYFEIAKNMRQSFLVHYAQQGRLLTALVLGTTFNVRAYPDDVSSETTLLTGKIRVTGEHRSIVMKPDQQLVIPVKGRWRQPKDINPDDIIAWKEGLLHFDGNDPLQAFQDIERCYGRKIEVSGQLHTMQIAGSFKRSLPFLTLLNTLSQGGKNFHYAPKDDKILISR